MKTFNTPKASPFLLLVLFVFITSSVHAQWGMGKKINGNGKVQTESRSVSDFDEVSVSAGITVIYHQGTKNVKVEADENLLDYIITEVKGDKLVVRRKNKTNIKKFKKMTVHVSSPNIYYISSSSGSKFKSENQISTSNLEIDCSSGAALEVSVSAKDVNVDCSSGSSASVEAEAESVDASVSSGASLSMEGSTNDADLDASSGASLRAKNLKVLRCEANASSAGSVSVTVSNYLDASASSGASVSYYGSPDQVERSTSSGGSVSAQ